MGAIRSRLSLDYGYANARVHAMRTHLLSERFADDLLKLKTNAAVAEYLSRTAYRDDFAGMGANVDDESRVELAVSRNFARTGAKLLRITPKASRMALEAFLYRYDIHNLKTILLARKLGKARQETESMLLMAGSLGKDELFGLLSAKSSDELYDAIRGTRIGARFLSSGSVRGISRAQIKSAFSNPQEGRLDLLMAALDSYYYEAAASAISPVEKDAKTIIGLLRFETDSKKRHHHHAAQEVRRRQENHHGKHGAGREPDQITA
jgi:V/A-type H+-transporting ATPase subunit C